MSDEPITSGSFDVVGALKAGYTADEVADHLAQAKSFDVKAARSHGYSYNEIINHLAGTKLPNDGNGLAAPVHSNYDPTDGMSGGDKFVAGIGQGMTNVARGVGQLTGLESQSDVDQAKSLDAPLLASGAGRAGSITGNIAATLPAALIPGGATLGGAAAIGAGLGAIQPVASDDSAHGTGIARLENMAEGAGGGLGGAVAGRLIGAGVQGAKALAEPFYESGRQQIAGRVLNRFGVEPGDLANVSNAPTVTGAKPTLAEQITRPEGAAAAARLQDSLGSVDPQIGQRIAGRAEQNNAARVQTLNDLAGSSGARDAASAARDAAAQKDYATAYSQGADASAVAKSNAGIARDASRQLTSASGDAKQQAAQLRQQASDVRQQADEVTDTTGSAHPESGQLEAKAALLDQKAHELEMHSGIAKSASDDYADIANVSKNGFIGGVDVSDLLKRPALRGAIKDAGSTAANFGIDLKDANPVQVLHYAKMNLDDQISQATKFGNNTEAAALMNSKTALMKRLNDISPDYKAAADKYAANSRPINQMDVAQRVLDKGASNTTDLAGNRRLMPASITGAVKDEGQLISGATGQTGITKLSDLLEPQQLTKLNAVVNEVDRSGAVARAGNGPGSATAQRLAGQNILQQTIGPTGLPKSWAESTLLNTLMKPVQWGYNNVAEPKIQTTLADLILDPTKAQKAMASLAPAKRTQLRSLLTDPALRSAVRQLPANPSTQQSFEQ